MGNIMISTGLAGALATKGSLKELLTDFVLEIFSGAIPASADDAESGTRLVTITTDGEDWSPSKKQVVSFDVTNEGAEGDSVTITITPVVPSGSNEVIQYNRTADDDTTLKVALGIAEAINANSNLVEAVACGSGTVVVSSKYKGDGFSLNVVASGSLAVSDVQEVVANVRGKGLHFESPQTVTAGVLEKANDDVWKGTVVATGTASYFRIKAHDDNGGADSSKLRIQGTVGTLSDSPLQISGSSTLTAGTSVTIGTFSIRIPLNNG
ncbi:MAG: hypothetical protein DRH57_00300 [Candidatus Cloacimonadota bacterium]|nr:MAG: hypothetical protein DRH57_00300 [Candidatus Cloacimonadota bacterium]